jgi:hypothetical protein
MSFELLNQIRSIALISVIIYFIFEYFDKKVVKDEREELIRLKTFEWLQKLNLWTVTVLAWWFFYDPGMSAIIPLMALVLTSLYGEIAGKIYFRRKY